MVEGRNKSGINTNEISMKCLPFIDFSFELRDNIVEKNRLLYR